MILQMAPLQEFKFLLVLSIVILGWQLSIFFFYNYIRLKDEKIRLNRILLSYGVIILIGMFSLFLLIITTLFIPDPNLSELFRKFAYISALIALFFFWQFISIKQYSEIISVKYIRIFEFITLIPIVLVWFVNSESQEFRYTLIFLLVEGVFLIYFQVKFIRTSVGIVKKRFILIFISAIILVIGIALGANTALNVLPVSKDLYDLLFLMGFFFMITGLSLMFVALQNFPPILEFQWKDNLLKLVIFNQINYSCLYEFDFPGQISKKKPNDFELSHKDETQLFSGGIIGIDRIISAITNTQEEKIKKIKQGNSYIFLDYSTTYKQLPITYSLVVKENLKSIRYFLSSVKDQFESFYKDLLNKLDALGGNVEKFFGSFEVILNDLLVKT
jgi:hypothetical protein